MDEGLFVVCLILLLRGVVNFEECLILVLIAVTLESPPPKPSG